MVFQLQEETEKVYSIKLQHPKFGHTCITKVGVSSQILNPDFFPQPLNASNVLMNRFQNFFLIEDTRG